jgi:hypothetical protein
MASTCRWRGWGPALWIAALGLAEASAVASLSPERAAAQAPEAVAEQRDERALEIARRMAAVLSNAESLRLTGEMAYDAVQADGQAIEFGATRTFALRRPDRARVEAVDRSGARIVFVYDGERIVLSDESHKVYGTAAHRGDFGSMYAYVRDELRVPTPLAEFLSLDLFDVLARSDSARWVDEQTLDGVLCDHLAFRNAERGLQIWVPRQGDPLPRRVVITYERARGRPQFRADLRDWEVPARLGDALFEYTPAADAERIYFHTGARIVPGLPLEEESR